MITVLMPVYNEGKYIYNNVMKVDSLLIEKGIEHQFLLVDDGSNDNTWDEMCRLASDYPHVSIIRLSRNFGKESALCAGLENAAGDAVVIMDSDLQHPPEYIPEMVRLWREEGYNVVEGVKEDRGKESLGSKLAALLFYRTFRRTTGIDIGVASDFKLMDRSAVEAWKKLPERNIFFRGLSAWVGFKRCTLPFKVAPRAGGDTKWTFSALVRLAINSITAYTAAPLFIVFWLGVLMGIGAVILGIQTLYNYFAHQSVPGFSTVILLLLFIGSAIMISLSIIGLYIAKIYDEVKARPRYIIMSKKGNAFFEQ
ncbi:MAG TPA: glycosyltransferase family 2 protein [Candidatus Avimonas sp.]|nr:glycosyltransferase family 2 protein [Clostridiales bacterium]HOB37284.1 glycosyltransferase family 2 protein [Candidatus Avimonas sp.]HQA16683.1 glycosyltransferase family 2 protein [Candidatus Avimonas sp.]HQD38769.1 glycosyltransferase family 2 protein [Candidatus Avimonas sp.]